MADDWREQRREAAAAQAERAARTRAAEAALSGADRAAMTLDATLSGFEPGLLGGASVKVTGLVPGELNGEWHLEGVTHMLSGAGLITSFRGKKGEAKKT